MTQKSIDLKNMKVLRSVELSPDLKPEAIKRFLNELSADATKRARTHKVTIAVISN
jgi:hypothetical protein